MKNAGLPEVLTREEGLVFEEQDRSWGGNK
jgi:hypothetical protein